MPEIRLAIKTTNLMSRRIIGFASTFAVAFLLWAVASSGQQAVADRPPKWMLEISNLSGPPTYERVPEENGEAVVTRNLDSQPTSDSADKFRPQPSALRLWYRMEGDSVRLKVSVLLGPLNDPMKRVPEESAGVYLIRPSESVTLDGLSRFGLKPIEVKVVSAEPPVSISPQIVNETTSLLVEKVDENRTAYQLSLRNTSPVAVQSLTIGVPDGNGGRNDVFSIGAPSHPLIPAGGLHEVTVDIPEGIDRRFANSAEPPEIVVEAAVFEDGTYEGDSGQALLLEAEQLGRETQRRRIMALVQEIMENSEADEAARLESLRSQILAISEKADPTTMQMLMHRFPGLAGGHEGSSAHGILEAGLAGVKRQFLSSLREYERQKQYRPDLSLQIWWEHTKVRIGRNLAP